MNQPTDLHIPQSLLILTLCLTSEWIKRGWVDRLERQQTLEIAGLGPRGPDLGGHSLLWSQDVASDTGDVAPTCGLTCWWQGATVAGEAVQPCEDVGVEWCQDHESQCDHCTAIKDTNAKNVRTSFEFYFEEVAFASTEVA